MNNIDRDQLAKLAELFPHEKIEPNFDRLDYPKEPFPPYVDNKPITFPYPDRVVLDGVEKPTINSTGTIGMKYDGGKQLANILFQDFPRALEAVVTIGTFGAAKYARSSWRTVPDAHQRYSDAMVRHQLAMGRGELYDDESHLLHAAHFAWNALATLELLLRHGVKVKDA